MDMSLRLVSISIRDYGYRLANIRHPGQKDSPGFIANAGKMAFVSFVQKKLQIKIPGQENFIDYVPDTGRKSIENLKNNCN